ncbi:relaxase/mobilization nuclease domain-containing protein [Macrococcoides caseolyticum]|uniref:relaxase/mobilization nuclease domain-containing protein n=1 Tax=Macrococcoides caseolyticum TaxID=69966 RepID=UPI000C3291EB|nr:relaxase/mobilization nuclease domain-containing protein [Macrococcus caseolyticus]PKE16173.1 hypothetical protein CW718_10985 [Macrococcus caseolyticus]PKE73538.1 hypothetical protein CW670_11460 [Macrococcus caseolyticus]PKF05299.1 hypothetical protein CW698_10600 [Macrococcus caseolyticus]PKF20398.1 hypothetical protein CW684_11040 [Macrococcus caseolyticus]PKF28750.1 hypothetical protein CW697_11710 [Macrococcus caseolyticus]
MSGINCDPSNAEYEFGVVRKAFNKAKDEGKDIQAHLIEQSFKGRDIDPFEVNQMGYELAARLNEELSGGFQAVVYTHGNTNNYHNHIVFNAVNLEDGHKYHCYQEKKIVEWINDAIVREHGYPVIEKNKERGTSVTIKKQKLKDKGEYSWKDDLRERIDQAFEKTKDGLHFDLERFRAHLTDLGVNIRERFNQKQQITRYSYDFIDQDGKKRVTREKNLGADYGAEGIKYGLEQERKSYEQFRQQQSGFTPSRADEKSRGEIPAGSDGLQERGRQVLDDLIRTQADEKLQRDTQTRDEYGHQRKQGTQDRTSKDHPAQPKQNRQYDRDEFER